VVCLGRDAALHLPSVSSAMKGLPLRLLVYRCRRALMGWLAVSIVGLVCLIAGGVSYGLEWRRQARDWQQAARAAQAGWLHTDAVLAGCHATSATATATFAAQSAQWQRVFRYCQAHPQTAACAALEDR